MKRFLVEDVKVGVSEGGMACGPVGGSVVGEVRIADTENGTVNFYSLVEVEGIPNFSKTDISVYEQLIREDEGKDFYDMLFEHAFGDFMGYGDFYESLDGRDLSEEDMIWKYLVYVVRASWEEVEKMKAESIGRCIGDFEIPVCDAEEEYMEDTADEDPEEEENTTKEALLEEIRDEYLGLQIDTGCIDLEEGDTYDGYYSTKEEITAENGNKYQLTYNFDINAEGKFAGISWPKCEKIIDGKAVPCKDEEVGIERIAEMLRDELDNWL